MGTHLRMNDRPITEVPNRRQTVACRDCHVMPDVLKLDAATALATTREAIILTRDLNTLALLSLHFPELFNSPLSRSIDSFGEFINGRG